MRLPIAQRELRVAAHSPATYRSRMYIAFAGIVALIWSLAGLAGANRTSPHLMGQIMFTFAAWAAFFLAAMNFGGISDAISSEKRAGTLGLLFLTHLRGKDVILGKLMSHGLAQFAGILSLFPVLTIPVLLGGIEPSQCGRLFLSILNMMLFSSAAGLLASTVCVRHQVAQSKAIQIILMLTGGFPLLAFVLRRYYGDSTLCLALDILSPIYAQKSAFGALAGPQQLWFILSISFVFAFSCALLALASWLVPRCWQDGVQRGLLETVAARFLAAIGTTLKTRSKTGRAVLSANPFQWLSVRDRTIPRVSWIIIATAVSLVIVAALILNLYWPLAQFWLALWLPVAFLLITALKVRVGGSAVQHIAEAKENGVLELILASSVSIPDIVAGQRRSARQQFGIHFLAVAVLLVIAFVVSLPSIDRLADVFTSPAQIETFRLRALLILLTTLLFLWLDSVAITWVGLCCAFRSRTPLKARSWTGFWVIAFSPTLGLTFVVILLQFKTLRPYLEQFYPVAFFWLSMKLLIDLLLIAYCRAWLYRAARPNLAAIPTQSRPESGWPTPRSLLRSSVANLKMIFPPVRNLPE